MTESSSSTDVVGVIWSSPDPPADAPSIALAKIDGKKLAPHVAPVNRAGGPARHARLHGEGQLPERRRPRRAQAAAKAQNSEGPAKFSVKNVSLQPGACYVVASDLLGDAWMEPVVRDARPTDPGFKLCGKR